MSRRLARAGGLAPVFTPARVGASRRFAVLVRYRQDGFVERADADRPAADGADAVARGGGIGDPFLADHHSAAFLTAGAGHADGALQPGAGGNGAVPEPAHHPTDGQPDLRTGLDPHGKRPDDGPTGGPGG